MKVGDTVAVEIAGQKVADATVRSIEDGQVTLVVPSTLVVMATRTTLAPEVTAERQEAETDRVLLTDQVEVKPTPEPVDQVVLGTDPEPVVETAPVTSNVEAAGGTQSPGAAIEVEATDTGSVGSNES